MEALQAEMDEMTFAWSGTIEKGWDYYCRIQGPTLIIEYAGQDLGGAPTITCTRSIAILRTNMGRVSLNETFPGARPQVKSAFRFLSVFPIPGLKVLVGSSDS